MNTDELARACDELHDCVDQGPGENPGVFARALSTLRMMRGTASWDYPISILAEIEKQLARWFSPDQWRGTDDGDRSRQDLLDHISRLEKAWERPRI
jgi:hypothetical protein